MAPSDRVPEWASFLSPKQYQAFLAAVEGELRRRGADYRLGEAEVVISDDHFGLLNLAQMCHQAPRKQWADLVRQYFEDVFMARAAAERPPRIEPLAEAGPSLRVRLMPPEAAAGIQGAKKEIAPGLVAVLARDLPTQVRTVSPDELAAWATPADALFQRGLAQLEPLPEPRTLNPVPGARVDLYLADHFFVASHALRLSSLFDAAPHGVLFAVPSRHSLLLHRIEDQGVVNSLRAMAIFAAKLYADGPGSITSQLYWWKDGQLVHLPTKIDGNHLRFDPPAAFSRELEGLPPAPR